MQGLRGGPRGAGTHLEQMISSDDCTLGSSPRWLSERSSFRRLMSPQGMMEGREDRQLAERSSSVIWQEMSMSQSRSTQGSLRWDHFTLSAWVPEREGSMCAVSAGQGGFGRSEGSRTWEPASGVPRRWRQAWGQRAADGPAPHSAASRGGTRARCPPSPGGSLRAQRDSSQTAYDPGPRAPDLQRPGQDADPLLHDKRPRAEVRGAGCCLHRHRGG